MKRLVVVGAGIGAALLFGGGYVVGMMAAEQELNEAETFAYEAVREQANRLKGFSEVMARGGVDEVVANIVVDCPAEDRTRFDTQLARLSERLSTPELDELSRLYDRCGAYFARGKALMTVRFEREVELYENLITRYAVIAGDGDTERLGLGIWREVARLENEQRALFEKLVAYQGRIITMLLSGTALDAPEITTMLAEVREVVELQTYNNIQLSNLRSSLPAL